MPSQQGRKKRTVTGVREITITSVTMDDGDDYTDYRRHGPSSWEVLMGCSWEQDVWEEEVLEAAYQEFINK